MTVKDVENLTINDIKPITISFKKNQDDLILYKWILKHSGYSSFVKDALRAIMGNERNANVESKAMKLMPGQDKSSSLIELDF